MNRIMTPLWAILFCISLISLSTQAKASYDGEWEGTTSQGKSVSFTVLNNRVTYLGIAVELVDPVTKKDQGRSAGTSKIRMDATLTFSSIVPSSNGISFSGELTSETTCTGTFYCKDSEGGWGGAVASGTWNATKISRYKIYYRDSDGDSYGDPNTPMESPSEPLGYVENNRDCNDNDNTIYPGAAEIRGDGIDQDCNGSDMPLPLTQTQISQLYVGIFGRASEGEGNAFWASLDDTMASTATRMLWSPAAREYFGASLDTNQAFIEHIYENTLGKTYSEDPDGIDYWVSRLTAGATRGNIIAAMAHALVYGNFTGNAEAIAAQNRFNNRVLISNYCADKIYKFTEFDNFSEFINGVTHMNDSVTAMKVLVDSYSSDIVVAKIIKPFDEIKRIKGESGESVYFEAEASGGTPPYTYYWLFENGENSSEKIPGYVFLSPFGESEVELIVTDSEGKTDKDYVTVKTYDNPSNAAIRITRPPLADTCEKFNLPADQPSTKLTCTYEIERGAYEYTVQYYLAACDSTQMIYIYMETEDGTIFSIMGNDINHMVAKGGSGSGTIKCPVKTYIPYKRAVLRLGRSTFYATPGLKTNTSSGNQTLETDQYGKVALPGVLTDGSDLVVECGQDDNFAKKVSGVLISIAWDQNNNEAVIYAEDPEKRFFSSSDVISLSDSNYSSNPIRMSLFRPTDGSPFSFRQTMIVSPTLGEKLDSFQLGNWGVFLKENSQITETLFLDPLDNADETTLIDIYESPISKVVYAKFSRIPMASSGDYINPPETTVTGGSALKDIASDADEYLKAAATAIKGLIETAKAALRDLRKWENWKAGMEKVNESGGGDYQCELTSSGKPDGLRSDAEQFIIEWGDGERETKNLEGTWINERVFPHTYRNPGIYEYKITLRYGNGDPDYKSGSIALGTYQEQAEAEFDKGLDNMLKNKDIAIQHFNDCISIMEDNDDDKNFMVNKALYFRGVTYVSNGYYDNATADFQKIIDTDWYAWNPLKSEGFYECRSRLFIGQCYELMENYSLALQYYQDVLTDCNSNSDSSARTDARLGIDRINGLSDPEEPVDLDTFTNSLGMTFVRIGPGTFTMGSPDDELGRFDREVQHQVTLTQPYYMQTTEVTQGQWEAVMGSNPSIFTSCGSDCPVENVSWYDAQNFINALNSMGEGTYSLPTGAQWECAARAGSTTAFANGGITETGSGHDATLHPMGWYVWNSGNQTHPVGQLHPNAWGLYDMHGNVYEWCQDGVRSYSSSDVTDPVGPITASTHYQRGWRGGHWGAEAASCRSAAQGRSSTPNVRGSILGLRLIRIP